MLGLSTRARHRLAFCLRLETKFISMLVQARLASGLAASCSSRARVSSMPTLAPRLAVARSPSAASRLSFAAASPMLLTRLLSSGVRYNKSPGIRTRLAAGAAARGKTDVDSSSADAAVSQPQPPAAAQPVVPRRTVEEIVKRITRGSGFKHSSLSSLHLGKKGHHTSHSFSFKEKPTTTKLQPTSHSSLPGREAPGAKTSTRSTPRLTSASTWTRRTGSNLSW